MTDKMAVNELYFTVSRSGEAIIIMPEIKAKKPSQIPKIVKDFVAKGQKNWLKPKLIQTPHGVALQCRHKDRFSQDHFRDEAGEFFNCIVRKFNGQFNF